MSRSISHEDTKKKKHGFRIWLMTTSDMLDKPSHGNSGRNLRGCVPSCAPAHKEELSRIVVDCAYRLHVEIGPGLLESVYEAVLEKLLLEKGIKVTRQQPVPIQVMGLSINEGFRADLIVENLLLIELKSVEKIAPVHAKQVLTYLRLLNLPLGLLINFGAATFKEGCKRIVNGRQDFASSRLRVNQNQQETT
jgi:GxxExxY protein